MVATRPRRELAKMMERGRRRAQKARKKKMPTVNGESGAVWVIKTVNIIQRSKAIMAVFRKFRRFFLIMLSLFY